MNYKGAASGVDPHEIKWAMPSPCTYKLNVDACFFPNGTGASAAILRNYRGEALAGISDVHPNLLDATTSEAVALQRGLIIVENLGCLPTVVETHSLELVEAFNGVIKIWSPYTAILMECF